MTVGETRLPDSEAAGDEDLVYPLSFAQERMWILESLSPGAAAYNLPLALRIRGALDLEALRRALDGIVLRHDVLRTRFGVVEGTRCQVVSPLNELSLVVQELDLPDDQFDLEIQRTLAAESAAPFVLAGGPLARAGLLRNRATDGVLFLTLHHAIADGWSLGVLMREFVALYRAARAGVTASLATLPIQYGDYAVWQRDQVASGALDAELGVWQRRLAGIGSLALPTDRSRAADETPSASWWTFHVGASTSAGLRELAAEQRATPFMALMAAWAATMRLYSGQDDFGIGTVVAGRQPAEVEGLIGLFANTVVLRLALGADLDFEAVLEQVKQRSLEAFSNQQIPFDRVVQKVRPERHGDESPLFQTLLVFQTAPVPALELPDVSVDVISVPARTPKFPLSISITPDHDGLTGVIEFDRTLFELGTIQRLAGHFCAILERAVLRDRRAVDEWLSNASPDPAQPHLTASATAAAAGLGGRVARLVLASPDRTAVRSRRASMSFGELDRWSKVIAGGLRRQGVRDRERVAVAVEDPVWRLAVSLGIIRAGAVYAWSERVPGVERAVADDSDGPQPASGAPVRLPLSLLLQENDDPAAADVDRWSSGGMLLPAMAAPETSALVSSLAIDARAEALLGASGAAAGDLAVFEADDVQGVLLAVCGGLSVIASADGGPDIPAGQGATPYADVALVCLRRAALDRWAAAVATGACPQLRTVICEAGGLDPCRYPWGDRPVRLVGELRGGEGCWYGVADESRDWGRLTPLAVPDLRFDVLDGRGRSTAAEVPGELVIGGRGLADGYADDPVLTAMKFSPAPGGDGRAFHTGARALRHRDGRAQLFALPTRQRPVPGRSRAPGSDRDPSPIEELLTGLFIDVLSAVRPAGAPPLTGDTDFFTEGGDSLLATLVVSRIREVLGVEIGLRSLFEAPTPRALAARVEASRGIATEMRARQIERVSRHAPLPLSYAQERMWLLNKLGGGGPTYNIAVGLRLKGLLDSAAVEWSLRKLVERHEALRTHVAVIGGEVRQEIETEWTGPLEETDTRPMGAEAEAEAERLAGEEAAREFDLERGPLVRARLIRYQADRWLLAMTMHHMVADGWSMGVLVREMGELYGARVAGREPSLPALPIQYVDYAVWQRNELSGAAGEEQGRYWRHRLTGVTALELPTDRPRPAVSSHRGSTYRFDIPGELTRRIEKIGQQVDATLFMTLLAAWSVVLHRYSGQSDIAIGTPIANRQRTELEGLIGFFVNTLVMRVNVGGAPSFAEMVQRVREVALEAYVRQDLPFERVVELVRPPRDLSRSPLFQVMFALQNAPVGHLSLPGVAVQPVEMPVQSAKFDLSLTLTKEGDGLQGVANYSSDLFDVTTIQQLVSSFVTLLWDAVEHPDRRLGELDALSAADRRLLESWNDTARPFPGQRCVHELVRDWMDRTPDAPAVTFGERTLSYGELGARAGVVAACLRRLGLGPEKLVGICLERSDMMIVAMLGALETGGGYVPLDPSYPSERLAFMIRDAGLEVLIAERALVSRLPTAGIRVICVDELDAVMAQNDADLRPDSPRAPASSDNVAYVVYTSGSTGEPKGIAIAHRSIVRMIVGSCATVTSKDCVAQVSNASFDMAPYEIWTALACGARLVVIPREVTLSPLELASAIERHQVTFLHLTTSLFNLMSQSVPDRFGSIHHLFMGGEAADVAAARRVLQSERPPKRLTNAYGPAENTMISTAALLGECQLGASVPIGTPVSNTQVFLLDAQHRQVPLGAKGEIYVAGDGLARGYWKKPGLTAERFVPNPFSTRPGARMYRTGDIGRLGRNGQLEFIGRSDDQVKIRGYRVEPREIRAVLLEHPDVNDAVVWGEPDPSGVWGLMACVASHVDLPSTVLRDYLAERLPPYMVPGSLVRVEALPLTPNGKVDRARLPVALPARASAGVAPQTAVEQMLAEIWAEVLGHRDFGVNDDLFEVGGHSLSAARIAIRVRERSGVDVPLRAIFEAPSIAGMARRLESLGGGLGRPAGGAEPTIGRADRSGLLPLSSGQQRLWLLDQVAPGTATYNLPFAIRLTGPLDEEALSAAFDQLVGRHEALRTRFVSSAGQAWQVVDQQWSDRLQVERIAGVADHERDQELARRIRREAEQGFDLATGPLFRARLIQLAEADRALVVTMHHIVSDGWSMGVLVRELSELYAARVERRPATLGPPSLQYADFAVWQRARLEDATIGRQLQYWRRQLEGAPQLDLPTDRPRRAASGQPGGTCRFDIGRDLFAKVVAFGQSEDATPFMTLLTAWSVLLHRYGGQVDVCVGTPVANRPHSALEGVVGFFVNTLAIRVDLRGAPPLREYLRRVRLQSLEAYANQDVPFDCVVEEVRPERVAGQVPVFQTVLVFQNAPSSEMALPGVTVTPLPAPTGTARFDLTLIVSPNTKGADAAIEYNADLFDAVTIQRLADSFVALLDDLARDPEQSIDEVAVLSAEQASLITRWNETERPSPAGLCVHQIVSERARAVPQAPAVIDAAETLTYADLETRAEVIAAWLSARGIGPERLVGVCLERSANLVATLLGILKAGAGYVPLDPGYPLDRLAFMTEDSRLALLITDRATLPRLRGLAVDAVCIEDVRAAPVAENRPRRREDPENVAYVLYTSGSTGRPKGIAITHRAIIRLLFSGCAALQADDCVAQVSNASFDAAPFEIWAALVGGARLVMVPREVVLSPPDLARLLVREQVTFLQLTTALLNQLAREVPAATAGLRYVFFGGEAADAVSLRRLLTAGAPQRLVHGYGPAEGTTITTAVDLSSSLMASSVPIGLPIANTQVYLLDRGYRPVPIGGRGEMFIAGEGLARGYWGKPSLTADRFVPNPFAARPGQRMYRTGDLARLRSDGQFEFLGRMDGQVKIRGHRIEPQEVEAVLQSHPNVRAAAVWADRRDDGQVSLKACVAVQEDTNASLLRKYLRTQLPEYMVPADIACIDELPLTPNGKVDRSRVVFSGDAPDQTSRPPRSALEREIAEVWSEVLGRSDLSVDANLFDVGGHSLLASRICVRLREKLSLEVPLRSVFEAPTIAALAAHLEERLSEAQLPTLSVLPIRTVSRDERLPLSFGQERLWVLDQLSPGSPAYNVVAALRMTGPLDVCALADACVALGHRHEVLRTRVSLNAGIPEQVIEARWNGRLEVETARGDTAEEREAWVARRMRSEAGCGFDLTTGPLFRVRLLRLDEERHALVLVMHHIVSDGWSMEVLVREIGELYAARTEGREPRLPAMPIQYADYAVWQRQALSGPAGEVQREYWRERLRGAEPLDLPVDRPRPAVQSHRGAVYRFAVPRPVLQGIEALGQQLDATLFMTLLAGWSVMLHRYSGQSDISIGTPIANRQRTEVEGLIGFFVNTLAMRVDLGGEPTFAEVVRRVREVALEAYAHQDLPFEQVVELVQPERDLSRSPLFQVMFALQNAPALSLSLPGVDVQPLGIPVESAKFDLSLFAARDAEGLSCALEYATDLFDRPTIERMAGHLVTLLSAAVRQPATRLGVLPLLTPAELDDLIREAKGLPEQPTLPGLLDRIAQHVAAAPDRTAVRAGTRTLSYQALWQAAATVAQRLAEMGIGPESVVAVPANNSIEMVVAALGALQIGAAYLPLDPKTPNDRVRFMLRDAGARALIGSAQTRTLSSDCPIAFIEAFEGPGTANPVLAAAEVDGDNLAYVIYTSGSTGQPKGVHVTRGGLDNYVAWAVAAYGIDERSHSIVHSSLTFDLTVTSLWCPLTAGGLIELVSPDDAVEQLIERVRAAANPLVLKLTPAHLQVLSETLGDGVPDGPGHTLVVGGEALSSRVAAPWLAGNRPSRVFNEYGPTETVVGCCVHELDSADGQRPDVPIGRPIAATSMYVLDSRQQLVPLGVSGEIFIGGAGVARGYAARPALTAQRFVPDPWGPPGARLYRTGDIGKQLADGTLVYLGRNDHQVKVRGFRVELAEIEAALCAVSGVSDAAVLLIDTTADDRALCAFVSTEAALTSADLARDLHVQLPDYMIPSRYHLLPALPLTPNGKVDRDALRALARSAVEPAAGRREPSSEDERWLATCWKELLQVDPGLDDDFFALGGTSLTALRLLNRIDQKCGRRLQLADIFATRTLKRLAERLAERAARAASPVVELAPPLPGQSSVYCVHPIGGSVGVYLPLADQLRGRRGCFGLEMLTSEAGVHAAALRYLREIESRDPGQPLSLCGWSFGAVVALETARCARAVGPVVDHLVLIDPADLAGHATDDPALLLEELAATAGLGGSIRLSPPDSRLPFDQQFAAALQDARRTRALPDGLSDEELKWRFELFAANRRALLDYTPAKWEAAASVFWAAGRSDEQKQRWRAVIGDLDERELVSDHYGVMRPPHVEEIAALLLRPRPDTKDQSK